ncbi:VPA1269 family protein [Bradyrhizobium betae]|uniref:VPA1269 family protein n=1 Tax=Bradyrhizobium betae TaxID=244734 RepID=UPI003D66F705
MADSDLTFMTNELIEGRYFNSSEDRSALIPSRADEPLELQQIVEAHIRKHAETDDLDTKNEVVSELMDLHRQGLILWPLGALWGRSAMGEVNEQRFARSVLDHDPGLYDVRNVILETKHFQESKWSEKEKANRSFVFWKFAAALHFAGEGIDGIEMIQEVHLVKMAEAFRVDGGWKSWVPSATRKHLRYLAGLLGDLRGDPLFAVAVRQDLRKSKAAARLTDILRHAPHLKWIEEQFELWIDQQNVLTKDNYRDGLRLLLTYLAGLPSEPARDHLELLSEPVLRPLLEYAKKWSAASARINAVAKIHHFCRYLSDEIAATGGKKIELGFREADLDRFKSSQAVKGPSSAHSDVRARPMPPRYHQMLKEIIREQDFKWAKEFTRQEKRVHWITWFNPEKGTTEPVFCEVLPRMLLVHLDLPLRNVQVRRLDSGEGDSRAWDPATGRWKAATGPHAGYWEGVGAKNPRRGVFREIQTLTGQITGFWVNSNKTQDGGGLFGENSGYEIPWQHEEALRNLAEMRAWQEKYNPVEGPLEHENLPSNAFDDDPSQLVKTMLPARFYLFRYPDNSGPRGNEAPVGYKLFYQFFHDALAELEPPPEGGRSGLSGQHHHQVGGRFSEGRHLHHPRHALGESDLAVHGGGADRDLEQGRRRTRDHPDDAEVHQVRAGARQRDPDQGPHAGARDRAGRIPGPAQERFARAGHADDGPTDRGRRPADEGPLRRSQHLGEARHRHLSERGHSVPCRRSGRGPAQRQGQEQV